MMPNDQLSGYPCLRLRLNVLFSQFMWVAGAGRISFTHTWGITQRAWTLLIRSCIKSPWYSKHKSVQKQQEGIIFIGAEVIFLLAALIFSEQKNVNKERGHMLSFPRITGCPCASKWAISMFCFHVNAEQESEGEAELRTTRGWRPSLHVRLC